MPSFHGISFKVGDPDCYVMNVPQKRPQILALFCAASRQRKIWYFSSTIIENGKSFFPPCVHLVTTQLGLSNWCS